MMNNTNRSARKTPHSRLGPAIAYTATTIALIVLAQADSEARGRRLRFDGAEGWDRVFVGIPSDADYGPLRFDEPDDPTDDPGDDRLPLKLKIGTQIFDRLWINENGFVSLSAGDTDISGDVQIGATSLSSLPGAVIAPFYSNMVALSPPGCDDNSECDIAFSVFDGSENPDSSEREGFTTALRVSWGTDTERPSPPGVAQFNGDANNRIQVQLRLIDRSIEDAPDTIGDFDLEFTYNGISWEGSPSLVGLKTDEVLVDFAKFYSSYLDSNPDTDQTVVCTDDPVNSEPQPPLFDPAYALACNFVTIRFQDGVPTLLTYTSDVSIEAIEPNPTANAAEDFPLELAVTNAGPEPATNVAVTLNLAPGASLVSSGATPCDVVSGIVNCSIASIAVNEVITLPLTLNAAESGQFSMTAATDPAQFDPALMGNNQDVHLTVSPTSDVTIASCTASNSVTINTSLTVSCTIRNDGPQTATDVLVTGRLPSNISFSSSSDCSEIALEISCVIASLASGASSNITVTATATTVGTETLTAEVSANEYDLDPGNNSASAQIAVRNPTSNVGNTSGGGGGNVSILFTLFLAVLAFARKAEHRMRGFLML